MAQFRKKPVVIQAVQLGAGNAEEVAAWCNGKTWQDGMLYPAEERPTHVLITTLEGTMQADPGDWIIRGVQGEFYPCKPDIFAATYDPVDAEPGSTFIEEAVDGVLAKYLDPDMDPWEISDGDVDRGDLASDLADLYRALMQAQGVTA